MLGVCAKGNKTNMPIGYWGQRSEGEGKPISNSHFKCLGNTTHQHVLAVEQCAHTDIHNLGMVIVLLSPDGLYEYLGGGQ